ncbi:MAG: hypothetical protein EAZ32_06000 [Cytophagia bacterium]|nr:MAG: hypothetical protein EAZ32_06000 [Cytophagia bacterium]
MKTLFVKLASLFLIIVLSLSCENKESLETLQETPVSLVQNTGQMDVSKAKVWFEKNVQLSKKSARLGAESIKKANWETALQMFSTKRGWYLQIPISRDNVSLTYSDRANGKNEKIDPLPLPTEMLYIFDDNGRYNHYVVELLPDADYLKKLKDRKEKVQIFDKKKYSGYFFTKEWDDTPKEGWYMKNGKVLKTLSPQNLKKNGRTTGCDWFTRYHFSIVCMTGGEITIIGHQESLPGDNPNAGYSLASTIPQPTGHNCRHSSWQFTEADLYMVCHFDDNGVPEPIEYFPFIPTEPLGPGIWTPLTMINYFNLSSQLNSAEINFYSGNTWMIPMSMVNRASANNKIEEYYCNNADDFNGNAFKHAYWSALNTWTFGAGYAQTMGQLHEGGSNSALKSEMDLHNNQLGITIALGIPSSAGEDVLIQSILNAISSGQGKRLALIPGDNSFTFTVSTDGTNRCN